MSQARFLSLVSDAKTLHPIVEFLFNAQPLSILFSKLCTKSLN